MKQEDKITEIPQVVSVRQCSECGFLIDQKALERMRSDQECPTCKKYKFSEFRPVPKLPPYRG